MERNRGLSFAGNNGIKGVITCGKGPWRRSHLTDREMEAQGGEFSHGLHVEEDDWGVFFMRFLSHPAHKAWRSLNGA